MLTVKETELERLERLAYLKDEDPSYYEDWKRLRDKLFNDEETIECAKRSLPIWVFFPSGKDKVYESKTDACEKIEVNFRTLSAYLDKNKPVSRGNAKGCYFYSLPKEDK
ncbi:MAG: hypothetical protein L0L19_09820 [Tetragenococcus halophilus]|nr:hypothetical protein [Tetragenococcus halophilus]